MTRREAEERQQDQNAEDRDHEHAAGVLDPLPDRQADEGQQGEQRDSERGCQGYKPRAGSHPRRTRAERVRQVGRDREAQLGREQDHVQPQIPGDHEPDGLVEAEFRPLVQSALEWHQLVEPDDHGRQRQVKQHDREQPQHDVRGSELPRDADPGEADDEQDLGQHEIADAELLLERRAVRLDLGFFLLEPHPPRRSHRCAHAASPSCRRCTRKNSFGAWKSSSPVEKEKYRVESPMRR